MAGGDFGKKELSPALANRFTTVWVPAISDDAELAAILASRLPGGNARVHCSQLLVTTTLVVETVLGCPCALLVTSAAALAGRMKVSTAFPRPWRHRCGARLGGQAYLRWSSHDGTLTLYPEHPRQIAQRTSSSCLMGLQTIADEAQARTCSGRWRRGCWPSGATSRCGSQCVQTPFP